MADISFSVAGLPTPQGSKSAWVNKKTGRAVIIDAGSKAHRLAHKEWRKRVKEAAEKILEHNPGPPLDEPLSITITFWFDPPESDKYRTRHGVDPDMDKLVRSVFDSLTDSKLVVDDSRFCTMHVRKRYRDDMDFIGAWIEITRLGKNEREDRERKKQQAKMLRKESALNLKS